MPTAISLNTTPDTTAGLATFFTTDPNNASLTNTLLRTSTIKRIIQDNRFGGLLSLNSIPSNRLSTPVTGAQIQSLSINGDAAGTGLIKHIAARSIGPADLSVGVLEWGTSTAGNAVGIGVAANASIATLNVSGSIRGIGVVVAGATNATTEGGQLTLLDPVDTSGVRGGWEIDNFDKSLRIFRDKLSATDDVTALTIANNGATTLNGLTVDSVTPKAAGSAATTIYRFHDGTNALNNAGLYYANSSVTIANGGSEIARFGNTIRFENETITLNSIGNRLVSNNVGIYQQNDGTTFTIFSTNASNGLGTTGGTYNNKILTATISTGRVGIGGDPDTTTDSAALNVTGILKVSSSVLASNLKIGGYTISAGTTNTVATFTGGATFGAGVTVSNGGISVTGGGSFSGSVTSAATTDQSSSSTLATKGYVDAKVPVIPDLGGTYLKLDGTNRMTGFLIQENNGPRYIYNDLNHTYGSYTEQTLNTFYLARTSRSGTTINYQSRDAAVITVDLNDVSATNLTPRGTFQLRGEFRATGNVVAFFASDKNLKENVFNINNPLEKILKLNGVEFDWKKDEIDNRGGEDGYFVRRHDVGVIAQEVQEVLPEVVATRPDGNLGVSYEKLVPLLIEAIKELNSKVSYLESKLNN